MAEINIPTYEKKKTFKAGIKTDAASLTIENRNGRRGIEFHSLIYPNQSIMGLHVGMDPKIGGMVFTYEWKTNETYKLLISQATDSAGNFSLYSGYIFLPTERKWKLIGTAKIVGRWSSIRQPELFYNSDSKQEIPVGIGQIWCQRQNGSWKNMIQKEVAPPVVNLLSHVDSLEQLQIDKKFITQKVAENKTDAKQEHDGIYHTILKEGTGRQVSVNDTVTVFYKGYLLKDNSVFDETKEKPATFPLKRLIMGWQIGVPLSKVGGKIKLIIPSNLAYSIRTRAAKIPPNSILVFEIEVVDAKAPQ